MNIKDKLKAIRAAQVTEGCFNHRLDDILRNIGVAKAVRDIVCLWDVDEEDDIIKHCELGLKFYFENGE